jgi:VanZ family protein
MAVIFYESSLADAPLPGGMSDKLAHAIGYAVLGGLVARAVAGGFPLALSPSGAALSVVIAVAYGASDEWHQSFVPGRTADLRDLLADATGAVAAVGAVWACGILWPLVARRRAPSRDL